MFAHHAERGLVVTGIAQSSKKEERLLKHVGNVSQPLSCALASCIYCNIYNTELSSLVYVLWIKATDVVLRNMTTLA